MWLASCSQEEQISTITPTIPPTLTNRPQQVPDPTDQPTITPTVTPAPTIPAVTVSEQVLDETGNLTIDRVTAADSGWIVIFSDDNGEAGNLLGYVAVERGDNWDLSVSVDPYRASSILYASLHMDGGVEGTFELPGPDRPVLHESEQVQVSFEVNLDIPHPSITVEDQIVDEAGLIVIDRVIAATPGWVVLYMDENGDPGSMLGFAPVALGENRQVVITTNWRIATPTIHTLLLEDAGRTNVFESDEIDRPVVVRDAEVSDTFTIFLPPDIFVLDQPVVDDSIVVERTLSYGPGWIVAYFDSDGDLGNIIGWASLQDGINVEVQIPLIVPESRVTSRVHLMIHNELGVAGNFDAFTDTARLYQDIWPGPTTFETDPGDYLITNDQVLSDDGQLTVSLVVVDQATWMVAHLDEDGQPGQIIGREWVPEGVNRDIHLDIDTDLVTPVVFIVLYQDAEFRRVFEFPDGSDIPLRENSNVVLAPIELLEDLDG